MTINDWCNYVEVWAERKGWNENLVLAAQIANLHTEISEAWEEIRNGRMIAEVYHNNHDNKKPEGFPIEIADLVIRVFHICGHYGIDLENMIAKKMEYNETRPHRHGGKTA